MNDVEQADHVLNNLRQKRDALVAHGIELAEQRQHVAFDAHTGDAKARARLDAINREAAVHDAELRSLDCAISEANTRAERSRTAETAEKDKADALALRKTVNEIGEAMRFADSHFGKAIAALNAVNDALDRIHVIALDPKITHERARGAAPFRP
jgi:chromosome segregation ATPase